MTVDRYDGNEEASVKKSLTVLVVVALVGISLSPTAAASAASNASGSSITCTIKAHYPHGSSHVSGTINAVGSVSCTAVVAEIYIKTTLLNVNTGRASSSAQDYFNRAYLSANATKSCSEGPATFKTKVDALVHFPAGYIPTTLVGNPQSPNVWVSCGGPVKLIDVLTPARSISSTYTVTAVKG